jgi:hypothetical protein
LIDENKDNKLHIDEIKKALPTNYKDVVQFIEGQKLPSMKRY